MPRRGFTLVEVLLVLAVLAVLAGVALPAVLRFVNEQVLKDGSETVRRELDGTRIHAASSGLTYQFRFEPGGSNFLAVPADREILAVTATAQATSGATATSIGAPAVPAVKVWVLQGTLRSSLTFAYEGLVQPAPERLAEEFLAGLPDAHRLADVSWSPPILFHPDGTAGAAAFRLNDDHGRFIELSVRELTGMASTSAVRQEISR